MQDRARLTQIIEASDKLGYLIEMTSGTFCVLLFAAMLVVTLFGVFFRYVMLNPFEWTEELARFLMLGLSFLAINIALRKREHIAIQFLAQKLPNKISKVLDYFVDILIGLFLIVLMKQGYLMATRTLLTTSTLNISMFWIYLTVPLGAFLTLLQLILNMTKKTISEFTSISHEIK
jgi:TRAP-type C4-dicarboxylate transport system permease small subunit